jgi:Flp pilus assembly protein CpaB
MENLERNSETDRSKRITILVVALLAVAAVIVVVARSFRGKNVAQDAAALTQPAR